MAELISRLKGTIAEIKDRGGDGLDGVADAEVDRSLMLTEQYRSIISGAAQRWFSETETAILNALPAHIALLDPDGTILAVNERWRDFGRANDNIDPTFGVGSNYIAVCEKGASSCSSDAKCVAQGLREVLTGNRPEFHFVYRCDSATESRWFQMFVVPITTGSRRGAVVMHVDETPQKAAEHALRESERKFRGTFEQVAVGFAHVDLTGKFLRVNGKFCHIAHRSQQELLALHLTNLLPTLPEHLIAQANPETLDQGDGKQRRDESTSTTVEGPLSVGADIEVWVRAVISLQQSEQGAPEYFIVAVDDVSARKKMERELKASEAQLRHTNERIQKILDSSMDVICAFDADGCFLTASAASERVWGYRPEELIGTPYLQKILPEDRAKSTQAALEIMSGKSTSEFENRYRRKDGSVSYIVWSATWSAQDQTMYCVARDQSPSRDAELEMHRLENRLTTTIEGLTEGFITLDRDWRFTYVNAEAERLLDASRERLLGKNHWEEFAYLRGTECEAQYRACKNNHIPVHFEFYSTQAEKRFDIRAFPMEYGLAINFRDITQVHRIQDAVREQAALLDQARDAIVVRTLDHRVTYWNKAAERLYGISAGRAIGSIVTDLLEFDLGVFEAAMRKVVTEGQWTGELIQTLPNGGKVSVESRWTLLLDGSGKAKSVLVINTDITERKQLEQRFLRSQRMESIGTLSGGIAHDFNNLLVPISVSVALLRRYNPDPRSIRVIDNIERSAKRGARLVEQVLSFARGAEGA